MTKKETIYLSIDSRSEVLLQNEMSIIWNSRKVKGNEISIIDYLEKNKKEIRGEYLEFINLLNQKSGELNLLKFFDIDLGFNIWWASSINEKNPWKKNYIYEVLKIFALIKILEKNFPNKIVLKIKDDRLRNALKKYCKVKKIEIETNTFIFKSFNLKFKYFFAKKIISCFYNFLRFFAYNFSFFFQTRKKFKNTSDKRNVSFFSFFDHFDISKCNKTFFYSNYWGDIQEVIINKNFFINWAHFHIPSQITRKPKNSQEIIKKINENSLNFEHHEILESYFSFDSLLWALSKWKILFFKTLFLKVEHFRNRFIYKDLDLSEYYFVDFLEDSVGFNSLKNLIYFDVFKKYFDKLPKQQFGLFLNEEQFWEKTLIYFWKKNNHGHLISVPHGPNLRFWDIYQYQHSDYYKKNSDIPLPDYIAVNNRSFGNELQKFHSKNILIELEALRYTWLDELEEVKIDYPSRILVLGDYLEDLTRKLLDSIHPAIIEMQSKYKFSLKLHHNEPMRSFDFKDLDIEVVKQNLKEIIKNYDICICGNMTYGAVDAFLAGLDVIVFVPNNEIDISPLQERHVSYYHDEKELVNLLKNYTKIQNVKKDNLLFINKDLVKWKEFIENLST